MTTTEQKEGNSALQLASDLQEISEGHVQQLQQRHTALSDTAASQLL